MKLYFMSFVLTHVSIMTKVRITKSTNCDTARDFLIGETVVTEKLQSLEEKIVGLVQTANDVQNNVLEYHHKYEEFVNSWETIINEENRKFQPEEQEVRLLVRRAAENAKKVSIFTEKKLLNEKKIASVQTMIKSLRESCRSVPRPVSSPCPGQITGRDCAEIKARGGISSGIYFIQPTNDFTPFPVYCDQKNDGGGWTIIHSHINDEFDFNRSWMSYRNGFGHVSCAGAQNFWIGNEAMHAMTSMHNYHMRVDVTDWSGNSGYAKYSTFHIGPESDGYRLDIGGYIAATDTNEVINDGFMGNNFGHPDDITFTNHNGMQFSTFDRDNDNYQFNCASQDGGGWWFNRCSAVNLNGRVYDQGFYTASETLYGFDNAMIWGPWTGLWYSLKTSSMKIRPSLYDTKNRSG